MAEYGRVEIEPAGDLLGRATGEITAVWIANVPGEPTPLGVRWTTTSGADVVVYAYDDTLLVASPNELELDDVTFSEVC